MQASRKMALSLRTVLTDVANGFFAISRNSFALIGLTVAFAAVALVARPDWRSAGESHLRDWLEARQIALLGSPADPTAHDRATATDPKDLPQEQAAVAFWLSKKYRVAPEPLAALVAEAYDLGKQHKLDPTLILAVMAIESSFNPFAQSPVGAQGLMQVMTKIHADKYSSFGGMLAAFDPVTNLRVGVKVLKECIRRAGSIEGGLRYYVGAANLPSDGGYAEKVLTEHQLLRTATGNKGSGHSVTTAKAAQPAAASAKAENVALNTSAAAPVKAKPVTTNNHPQSASTNASTTVSSAQQVAQQGPAL